MNFGQNLFDWLVGNAQPLVLAAIVIAAIILAYQRKFTELIGVLVVAVIAVGLVFNTSGTKDTMLKLYNQVVVGGAAEAESDQR